MTALATLAQGLKERDLFVPKFEVRVDKQLVKAELVRDVLDVTFRDHVDKIDGFDLTINNWDAENRGFKYTDQSVFDPGRELTLEMGYQNGGTQRMLRGTIKSLRMTYPASGGPQLSVSGVNVLDKFRGEQKSHVFREKTDAEIFREVAGKLGVPIEVHASLNSPPHPYVLQDNQTNIVFLLQRARSRGYDIVVREEDNKPKMYVGPSGQNRREVDRLTYGLTLTDFALTLNTTDQVSEVIVRSSQPTAKSTTKVEAKAKLSQLGLNTLNDSQRLSGLESRVFSKRNLVITDKTVDTVGDARRIAEGTLSRVAKNLITGSGATVGLPELRAGTFVEIDGIGDHFAGRYFITSTTHKMGGGGYRTQFTCRKE